MTPDQARAAYRRQIDAHGETITLRRGASGVECSVRARVTGFAPDHLDGGMTLGERRVVMIAEDIPASWPGPPRKRDVVVWNGIDLIVVDVDMATRRVAGETIAFDLHCSGQ